ncbi:unnamed protein product [Nippostrongylus brasiliensis]|uniref:NR LBD domain-containing protein n=1 Tax=Nippostrongylus brasiliensis TaxID=27835 RepID=A0A158QYJ9_NIPBR|nr:unnamed protein product [Nippostrongylus brasiliensis]
MINNDGVFSSTRSVEERVRVLEEALKEAQFLIGELKRQLLQAEEDYRTKLRKKSATLIAWQSAYDELKEKSWTARNPTSHLDADVYNDTGGKPLTVLSFSRQDIGHGLSPQNMIRRGIPGVFHVSAMSEDVLNLPEPEDENQPTWVIARKVYPKNVCPTTCAVCGDSASGYHYEVLHSLHVLENSIDRLIDELVYLEIKTDKFRKSSYNPTPLELPRLEDALSTSSLLSLADKLEPMPNWPLEPIEHFIPRVHSSKEECECPMLSEKERKNWFFFDILSCVEWAKTFPVLHKLARSDQLILLKFVVLQCFNATQAFFSYENKSDSVIHPDGTRPHFFANIFTDANPAGENFFRVGIEPFIRHKIDKKEYVLLKALMLCNATVDGLSEDGQRILSAERSRYSAALFSYCLAARGVANAPSHYAALIAVADVLSRLSKIQKDVHVLVQMKRLHCRRVELIEDIMD